MTRSRTYLRSEIEDAAAAAAMHGVRVVMHPSGEIEFAPKSFAAATDRKTREEKAEDALQGWLNGRKTRGGA